MNETDDPTIHFKRVPGTPILFDMMVEKDGTTIVIKSQSRRHINIMMEGMGIVIPKIA